MSAPTRILLLALGTTALLGSAALPARADDDHWRHERREREWREHERHEFCERHPYRCGGGYYYAPPPVYYAPAPPPPPVYYAPAPSVDIVIPFHIR